MKENNYIPPFNKTVLHHFTLFDYTESEFKNINNLQSFICSKQRSNYNSWFEDKVTQ